MSEHKESLSALMDGEANELELRRLLKQTQDNNELSDSWQRYHLASALMKREPVSFPSPDFSQRVMQSLDQDMPSDAVSMQSAGAEAASPVSGMMRSLISMAVAASVTAVVILGPGWLTQDTPRVQTPAVASATVSDSIQRNQLAQPVTFGQRSLSSNYSGSLFQDDDMIRAPANMQRYIDQHLAMVEPRPLQWGLAWLPEGYQNIRHESTRAGEVMVFSNGHKAFSVSVEKLGLQSMPEGVTDAGNFIALGKATEDRFVTVVGDMPIMVAERIAAAVTQSR